MRKNWLILIFWSAIFCFLTFHPALAQVDPGIRDTCRLSRFETVPPNSTVVMDVYVFNDEAIAAFTIALGYPDTLSTADVVCDSISFVGTRSGPAALKSDMTFCPDCIDNAKHRLEIFAVWFAWNLAPGSGPVAKLYFTTGPLWEQLGTQWVDTLASPGWPSLVPSGSLQFVDTAGTNSWTPIFYKGALDVKDVKTPTKPTVYSLAQNYPNPFNPKTMIRFGLPRDSWVKLEVFNILGQKVRTLVDEKLTAGVKEVEWDGRDSQGLQVATGIYFYKINADKFSDVRKMVMLK